LLQAFDDHLKTAVLGQISEITDADSPYEPRACAAQAWSIGELLRAAVEDVYELPLPARTEAAVARL
jgi:glycogen debranching enzyme